MFTALTLTKAILGLAEISGAIDGILDQSTISLCDLVLITINPNAAVEYLEKAAPSIDKKTVVIDCCGVKRSVCAAGFGIAEKYGFTFVGGHPMAGTHNSGFKYSKESLFKGASMILVPPRYDDMELYSRVEALLKPIGFGRYTFTTAKKR